MDTNQLHELATNARLNHWPPHLGVTTDAEKIEYLARALADTAIKDAQLEEYERRIEELEDETVELETKIDERDDRIEKLEEKVKDLSDENGALKQEIQAVKGDQS